MSEKKIAVYARVGNAEKLSDDKPAWIYIRKGSIPDPESFDRQRIAFREQCEKQGYRILGETVAVGKGDVSMGALQNIILSENAVKHILSPSISCQLYVGKPQFCPLAENGSGGAPACPFILK